jgi:hypothetical protein
MGRVDGELIDYLAVDSFEAGVSPQHPAGVVLRLRSVERDTPWDTFLIPLQGVTAIIQTLISAAQESAAQLSPDELNKVIELAAECEPAAAPRLKGFDTIKEKSALSLDFGFGPFEIEVGNDCRINPGQGAAAYKSN